MKAWGENPRSVALDPNSDSPLYDMRYPDGDRPETEPETEPGTLSLSLSASSVGEGGQITVTITRSGGEDGAISCDIDTSVPSGSNAVEGEDYTALHDTVELGDGVTSASRTIQTAQDSEVNGSRDVRVTISNPQNGATIGSPASIDFTITDDDTAAQPGTLQFTSATYSVAENGGTVTLTIERVNGSDGAVSCDLDTSDGTAVEGAGAGQGDYDAVNTVVEFADGETSQTVDVTINDNASEDGDRDFTATLSNVAGGASLGSPTTTTVTITDDEGTITPQFEDGFEGGEFHNANGFSWAGAGSFVAAGAFEGTHAMLMRYGPNAPGGDDSTEQRFTIAPDAQSAPTEVWFEWMWYIPANFIHRDDQPANNKLFGVWAENYSTNGDIQSVFEFDRVSDTESDLRVLCMSGGGCLQGNFYNSIIVPSMLGNWTRLRFRLKAGDGDGAIELWRDNVKVYDIFNYVHHFDGGNNYWRHGYVMGWSNSGYDDETDFLVDQFRMWFTDPGWSF